LSPFGSADRRVTPWQPKRLTARHGVSGCVENLILNPVMIPTMFVSDFMAMLYQRQSQSNTISSLIMDLFLMYLLTAFVLRDLLLLFLKVKLMNSFKSLKFRLRHQETQYDAEVQNVADQGLQYQAFDLPMNNHQHLMVAREKVAQLVGHEELTEPS